MKNLFNRKSKCNIMQIDINTLNKISTMRLKGLRYRDIENLTGISFGSVYGFISRNTKVRYLESLKYKGYITLRNYSLKYNIKYERLRYLIYSNQLEYIKSTNRIYILDKRI